MKNYRVYAEKQMRRLVVIALGAIALLTLAPMAQAQAGGEPYLGEIIAVPYDFAPRGWALCQGQILSIQQNTALFALLGTTYGGNGVNTFALPDLRGRSAVSSGQGPGLSNYSLGQNGGEESVTLQVSQMPTHNHSVQASTAVGNQSSPAGNAWAAQGRAPIFSSTDGTPMSPGSTSLTGGSQPHDNMSPYLTLNYVIALQGIFPSRN